MNQIECLFFYSQNSRLMEGTEIQNFSIFLQFFNRLIIICLNEQSLDRLVVGFKRTLLIHLLNNSRIIV